MTWKLILFLLIILIAFLSLLIFVPNFSVTNLFTKPADVQQPEPQQQYVYVCYDKLNSCFRGSDTIEIWEKKAKLFQDIGVLR